MNAPMNDKITGCYICITCGSQFAETAGTPVECPICLDERQYVRAGGQEWTTLEIMRQERWKNAIRKQEPRLFGIGTEPKFGIGQRALLIQARGGNVLWDCVTFLDEETIHAVRELGGISAIAISHPHYYSTMVEWSRAFGDAPIYLHEAERKWVQRPDANIHFWSGETKALGEELTLHRLGGHFPGFQVLHWWEGAAGQGVLFSGDQPQVCADLHWVSFMWSYPNYIPLSAPEVEYIASVLEALPFDRLYGAFWPRVVVTSAKETVRRSAARYLRRMREPSEE